MLLHRLHGGDMHGCREAVVGALRAVDVVVGVHRCFATTAVAGQFIGAPSDHFINIHIALRTAAGLPDHQGKLLIMLTGQDFIGGLLNQSGQICGQFTDTLINPRRSFLDQRQGMSHWQGHALLADGEVDQRALSLCAPVGFIRYVDGAEAVGFSATHGDSPEG